mgnify:CR=1 FL=1
MKKRYSLMTAGEFRGFGLALYGKRWKVEMARALGVTTQHIHRLAGGESPVWGRIAGKVVGLVAETKAGGGPRWVVLPGTQGRIEVEAGSAVEARRRAAAWQEMWRRRLSEKRRRLIARSTAVKRRNTMERDGL